MNEIDMLKQLSQSPATGSPVDVTARVIRTLQSGPLPEPPEKSPWVIASASVVVALVLGLWAWQTVSSTQDSFSPLAAPFEVHLQ